MIVSPFADDFEIISAGNTTIIHCQLSIIHCASAREMAICRGEKCLVICGFFLLFVKNSGILFTRVWLRKTGMAWSATARKIMFLEETP